MPKETATAPQVTYGDLKKQRLAVGIKAMIRYKGELYNQFTFHDLHGGGTWRYNITDLKIFDPVSTANYDVKPSVTA